MPGARTEAARPPLRNPRLTVVLLANVVLALVVVLQVWPKSVAHWSIPENDTPLAAVTAIAGRHIHSSIDDDLTPNQMSEIALTQPIYATCTPVSLWAVHLLTAAGFKARVVAVLTLEKWNKTNNGHTFIEIREGSRWVAYDIDRSLRWTDSKGRSLSMIQWVDRVHSGNYRIVPLLGPIDQKAIRRADARVAQVPLVQGAGGLFYFPSQGARNASILGYSPDYRMLPTAVWRARFYSSASA